MSEIFESVCCDKALASLMTREAMWANVVLPFTSFTERLRWLMCTDNIKIKQNYEPRNFVVFNGKSTSLSNSLYSFSLPMIAFYKSSDRHKFRVRPLKTFHQEVCSEMLVGGENNDWLDKRCLKIFSLREHTIGSGFIKNSTFHDKLLIFNRKGRSLTSNPSKN